MSKKCPPPNKAEREWMGRVKNLPCCICNHPPPSDCHHITDCGRRIGHLFTLPLCYEDHRGRRGFSGLDRSAWDKSLENQLRLLEIVKEQLGYKVTQ